MQLPTTISLSDTETLKALAAHGILISDLIASGKYRYRQVGNAVPVLFAKQLGFQLKNIPIPEGDTQ